MPHRNSAPKYTRGLDGDTPPLNQSREAAPGANGAGSRARALALEDVNVRFGDFAALTDVTVTFEPGKVHAIVGQNGAGKTTLARAVMGLVGIDSGAISWGGDELANQGVRAARNAGFAMVHQAFTLPPSLTVAEAMEFYAPGRRSLAPFSRRRLESYWTQRLSLLDVRVDVTARVGSLPVETIQSLEIARALVSDASVLILDEPTAVLAPQEATDLFARLKHLANSGLTVLVILHKVNEVLGCADTVTVLRGGHCVEAAAPASGFDGISLSSAIIGADRSSDRVIPEMPSHPHEIDSVDALALCEVTTGLQESDAALSEVSTTVKAGEIHGIAGVEGNGQRVLVDVVLGATRPTHGEVRFGGDAATDKGVGYRRSRGLRAVPFERLFEGVSRSSAIWENVGVGALTNVTRTPLLLHPKRLRRGVIGQLSTWRVRYRSVDQQIGELSGGNIQRAIFAREIDDDLKLLIAAQPTRGLDIGATEFVHHTLVDLRGSGAGILLVSSDLDELMDLSDRISVIRRGSLVAEFSRPFDRLAIGRAMVGAE